jgi:hypothetical protein
MAMIMTAYVQNRFIDRLRQSCTAPLQGKPHESVADRLAIARIPVFISAHVIGAQEVLELDPAKPEVTWVLVMLPTGPCSW